MYTKSKYQNQNNMVIIDSQFQHNLKRYISVQVQLKLMLQQHYIKFTRTFQVLILTIASMQSAIFILRPIIDHQTIIKGHAEFLNWIMYFARIELFVIDFIPGLSYKYYYIVPFAVILIFEIVIPNALTIYQLCHSKHENQYLHIQKHNQSFFISFLLQSYSVYAQLFLIYIKVPQYILLINQLKISYINNEIGYLISAIILLFLLMLTHLQQLFIFQESDSLQVTGFLILNFSVSDVIIEILLMTQLIFYAIVSDSDSAASIQAILIIMISSLKLIQVIFLHKFPLKAHNYTIIVTESIKIVYAACWLTNYTDLMSIIVLPAIYIFIQQYQIYLTKIIIEIDILSNIKDMRSLIALLINDQFTHIPTLMILQASIIWNRHKSQCQILQCQCQNILVTEEPKELQFYKQHQLVQIYLNKIIAIYSQQMNLSPNKIINNAELLQYAQILNELGQPQMAMQLCAKRPKFVGTQDTQTPIYNRQNYYEFQTYRSINTIQYKEEQFIVNKEYNASSQIDIKQQQPSSWLMNIKFKNLIYKIKQQLFINFEIQSDPKKQQQSYYIQKFVDHENRNQEVLNEIIKIIQQKVELYQILVSTDKLQAQQMFKSLKQIGQMALDLEIYICKQYDSYPSIRQQSLICFFYAEVMNNLLAAFQFASLTAMSEEKLMNLQINTNVFSKEVNYMILSLDKYSKQIQIEKYSNNIHMFFGYQYSYFKQQSNIDFLLPIGMLHQHRTLVSKFMQTGRSKFLRDQNISFYKDQHQFMKPFKIMTDIHYNQVIDIGFIAFFDQCQSDSVYILVDTNNIIGGITQSFFEKVGFTKEEIMQYGPQLIQSFQCHIAQVIPKFQSLKMGQQSCKMKSVTMNYLRDKLSIMQSKNSSWWNKKSYHQIHNINAQVKSYECNESQYHIIQIDNIQTENEQEIIELENNYILNSIDEEVRLLKPMDSFSNNFQGQTRESIIQLNQMITLQQSCKSPDLLFPSLILPNYDTSRIMNTSRIQIQQQFFTNPSREENINSISLQMNNEYNYSDRVDQGDVNLGDEKKIKNQNQKRNLNNNVEDLETSATTKIRKSILFSKYDLIAKTTNRVSIPKSLVATYITIILFIIISAIYYLIILTNNTMDMRRFIKEAELLGVHSAFMAPLDNYQAMRVQIIQYQTMYRAGYSLQNVTIYANYTNWLSTRLQDGYNDMQNNFQLQFTNPYTTQFYIDNYILARFQYTNQTVLQSKNITFEESLYVMLSYQFSFKGQYKRVNVNNYQQNSNFSYDQQNCSNNTSNQSILITNSSKPGTSNTGSSANTTNGAQTSNTTNSSTTQCRNRTQQYTNQYGGQNNQPYQIYAMANYFNFHNKFDDLSQSILAYSLNRKDNVKQEWIKVWAAFIAVNVFIIAISYYFYRFFIKHYEQFIDLYKHLDHNSLQHETNKYKLMINNLEQDSNVLFRYHFDFEQKEASILEQKKINESPNIHIRQKQQKRYRLDLIAKLPYMLSLIGFSSFIILFMTFSMIIQIQNFSYLDKYSNTAQLYVSLSDITYVLPGLYFQRNLANTISSYPYLNQSDINELYTRIAFGLQTIQNFQNFLMNYNSGYYLSDSNFNSRLSNMNTQGICDYLDQIYQQQVSQYCPLAFQGALKQGYQYSLNYIYHSFQNEQAINNFTNQTIYNLFEVEGAYILMRATQSLQSNLYNSIQARTSHCINTSIEISVIYIIIASLILVCLFAFVMDFYRNEFFIIRRSVLILPTQTLFLDDVFERSLRFISFKDVN